VLRGVMWWAEAPLQIYPTWPRVAHQMSHPRGYAALHGRERAGATHVEATAAVLPAWEEVREEEVNQVGCMLERGVPLTVGARGKVEHT